MDAHAITLATRGDCVGVAPLGTALTQAQARQLAGHSSHPIIATDGDLAGQIAAQRSYWLLSQHGTTPAVVHFPDGSDPADTLERRGPGALMATLRDNRTPLSHDLVAERLSNLTGIEAAQEATTVLAATTAQVWDRGITTIAATTGTDPEVVRVLLVSRIRQWNDDPRGVVQAQLGQLRIVRDRMTPTTSTAAPAPRAPRLTRHDRAPQPLGPQTGSPTLRR